MNFSITPRLGATAAAFSVLLISALAQAQCGCQPNPCDTRQQAASYRTMSVRDMAYGTPYDFDFIDGYGAMKARTQLVIWNGPGGMDTSELQLQEIISHSIINQQDLYVDYDPATRQILDLRETGFGTPTSTYPPGPHDYKVISMSGTPNARSFKAVLSSTMGLRVNVTCNPNAWWVLYTARVTNDYLREVTINEHKQLKRAKINRTFQP